MTDNPAGWQSDPTGRHEHRYWDGSQWTDHVSDAGVASTDAYDVAGDVAGAPAAGDADDSVVVGDPADAGTAPDPTTATDWNEPTLTQPAAPADATAKWPAPPAPPVPPVPSYGTGPAEPEPAAGSKRRLLIGGGILAAVVLAVVAFLLLGGDDDDSSVEARLAAQIQAGSEGQLSDDQAKCVSAHIVDEIGVDRMEGVDFDADEPPAGMEDELIAASFGAIAECGIDPSALGGVDDEGDEEGEDAEGDGTYGSDEDLDELYDQCADGDYAACDDLFLQSPSGSEYEEFGDTCGDRNDPSGYCVDLYEGDDEGADLGDVDLGGDMEETLADIYEQSLGLDRDKAECLAGRLADAIESGDLSEEEAMTDVFSFLEECDISMEEIGN